MTVRFHGAAGEVTGSCHEVEAAGHRLVLDCGMIQGGAAPDARTRAAFPFDAAQVDAVVLNAAIMLWGGGVEDPIEAWDDNWERQMRVNVLSPGPFMTEMMAGGAATAPSCPSSSGPCRR